MPLAPAIRRALRELEESAPGNGGIQLVRWSPSPWVVRWSLGVLPELGLSARDLAREPASLWTRIVAADRDTLRSSFAAVDEAAVLEYRLEVGDGVRWVRESVRRVDFGDDRSALVSFLRDVTAARALSDEAPPPSAGLPTVVDSGPRVLLVEDDSQVRSVMARILRRAGYGVLEAASSGEALRVWEGAPESIAVLVADVILPDRAGPELARVLLRRDPALRVVFVSGYSVDDLQVRVRLPSDAIFLAKPFHPRDLADAVREARERRGGGGAIEGPRSAV